MNAHSRMERIISLVNDHGELSVPELAEQVAVSQATIRRDLHKLAHQQLIIRTRGGARSHPSSTDLPMRYRTAQFAEEKYRIAQAAATMVSPGQTVGLNGGTTATEVGRELAQIPELGHGPADPKITVITNAVNIANELAIRPQIRVVVTGGIVRALSHEMTGPLIEAVLRKVAIDITFLGVEALHPERGAFAAHAGEAAVNAALARCAEQVVIVTDHSKLGKVNFAQICKPSMITTVITDDGVPADQRRAFANAGIDLTIV